MTLEEKARILRSVDASHFRFAADPSAKEHQPHVKFAHVEQQMLIERLLSSDSATDVRCCRIECESLAAVVAR